MLIKKIAIKDIKLRDYNRDQITDASVRELAESISENGLLQPILVSTAPAGSKQGFDLVAGERRLRACKLLGAVEIDAHVTTMGAVTQKLANLTENLHRQNLTVWEESKHVAKLKDLQPEARVEDLAAKLGRSSTWVAQRMAVSKLLPSLRDLVEEQNWPIGHIVLLARLRPDAQADALEHIKQQQKNWYGGYTSWDPVTHKISKSAPNTKVLRELLARSERRLSEAKWKLNDAELVQKAGACSECTKRSSQEGLLFQDPADDPKHDKCLDARCWKQKEAALVQINITKLKSKGEEPICLGSNTGDKPKGIDKVYDRYDYQLVKKSTPGAKPAVVVNGERAGEICYVKPMTSSAVTMGSHRTVNQETGKKEGPSKKERLATLLNKRLCAAVEHWREALTTIEPELDYILPMIATFGTEQRNSYLAPSDWDDFDKVDVGGKEKLKSSLYQALFPVLSERCRRVGTLDQGPELWKEASRQSDALGTVVELFDCWNKALQEVKFPNALAKAGEEDPHKPNQFPILDKPTKKKS